MSWRDRLQVALDDYAIGVIAIAALLILAGAWLTYDVHAGEPEIETQVVTTEEWNEQGGFTYGADVQRENPVFEEGHRFTGDQFYRSLAPELDGTYDYRHTHEQTREVTLDVTLIVQATADDQEFWREETSLGSTTEDVGPGETVSHEWRVDVDEIEQRINEIEEGLGFSPGNPEAVVHVQIRSIPADGSPTSHHDQLVIDPSGNMYSASSDDELSEEHSVQSEETVETSPGLLSAASGPLLILIGLAIGGPLGLAYHRDELEVSASERERIGYEQTRAGLNEWVTVASRPRHLNGREVIRVGDIEGLVDLAIDTGQRVMEDEATQNLFIRTNDALYIHSPPVASPTWEELLADDRPMGPGPQLLDPAQQQLLGDTHEVANGIATSSTGEQRADGESEEPPAPTPSTDGGTDSPASERETDEPHE